MVKLKGPALSPKASGTLGGALIFSSSKGRAYLKKHRKPKQPRSGKQKSMRAMMTFLSQAWSPLPGGYPETWQPLADERRVSPFNAYLAANLARWRSQLTPSALYPPTTFGDRDTIATVHGHGGVRSFLVHWTINVKKQGWGMCVTIDPVAQWELHWDQLVLAAPMLEPGYHEFRVTGIEPGTYRLWMNQFLWTGKEDTAFDRPSITVTD